MKYFRHGQWVKFDPSGSEKLFEHAYKTEDGMVVGIYQHSYMDSTGNKVEEHVVAVGSDGNDAMFFDGKQAHRASINPLVLKKIEPLLDKSELPPGRVVSDTFVLRP
jgi:hypothetical protein